MRNLNAYIEKQNIWNAMLGKRQYNVKKLTDADVAEIRDMLECELSPENLCCDGELRGKALMQKLRWLQGAMNDLNKIAA